LKLPVIIHNRDAHADVLDILKSKKDKILGGIMHCYSGSWEMAKNFLDLGFYISLGGPVTFKNARKPVEVAKNVPLDRLLIETDSPYLAPVPYRGKRNDPGLVRLVAEKLPKSGEWILTGSQKSPRLIQRGFLELTVELVIEPTAEGDGK